MDRIKINSMKLDIKEIDKINFNGLTNIAKVFEEENATQYWVIKGENVLFGFGWYTELDPKIIISETYNAIVIASFTKVFAISSTNGTIEFALGFNESVMSIEEVKFGFLIITETSITMINGNNYSLGRVVSVPDIILDYNIVDDIIFVETVSGGKIKFEI